MCHTPKSLQQHRTLRGGTYSFCFQKCYDSSMESLLKGHFENFVSFAQIAQFRASEPIPLKSKCFKDYYCLGSNLVLSLWTRAGLGGWAWRLRGPGIGSWRSGIGTCACANHCNTRLYYANHCTSRLTGATVLRQPL